MPILASSSTRQGHLDYFLISAELYNMVNNIPRLENNISEFN